MLHSAFVPPSIKCTAAELVYGTSLRLPGEFFVPQDMQNADPANYVTQLKDTMKTLRCTPIPRPLHSTRHPDNSLSSATHVFVRHDAIGKPLQPPYYEPHRILDRSDCSYKLDLNGRTDSVSIDRLKPAHIDFPIAVDTRMSFSSTSSTTTPPSQPILSRRTLLPGPHVRPLASPSQGFRSLVTRWRGSDVVAEL